MLLFTYNTLFFLRKNRQLMRRLNVSRSPEEETETWITIGSLYLCGSFLIFTSGVVVIRNLEQNHIRDIVHANPDDVNYHVVYVEFYRNLISLLLAVYKALAFVLYVIQNNRLRAAIGEFVQILLSLDSPGDINEAEIEQPVPNVGEPNAVRYAVQIEEAVLPVQIGNNNKRINRHVASL